MLSWGRHTKGQLGQGGIEEEHVKLPRFMRHLTCAANAIEDVACGYDHTLVALKSGVVLAFGSNEQGQLAQTFSRSRPEQVHVLSKVHVSRVACGEGHSVAVTHSGDPVTWGSNSHGQLSQDKCEDNSRRINIPLNFNDIDEEAPAKEDLPSLPIGTTFLKHCYVVCQVACGASHNVALTIMSDVLCWGSNERGQCGLPRNQRLVRKPTEVPETPGSPIVSVAAGGSHSFALSAYEHVYGWGCNTFGQLGLGHTTDQFEAVEVECLHSLKVKYIACGEDHTAVITQTGGLLTFGSGSYGQLGHGDSRHENTPKLVFELSGSEVTQVACGRRHTLALVAVTGKLYAFGQNGCGQLGTGDYATQNLPTLVAGQDWRAYSTDADMGAQAPGSSPPPRAMISLIAAGGDQSFAVINTDSPPLDFRVIMHQDRLAINSELGCTRPVFLSGKLLRRLVEYYPDDTSTERLNPVIRKLFEHIFSTPATMAMCFGSSPGSEKVLDYVDMLDTVEFINDHDTQLLTLLMPLYIQTFLPLRLVQWHPPTVESCRFFMFLLALPIYDEDVFTPNFIEEFFLKFCHCFSRTNLIQRQAMASWFNADLDHFRKAVELCRRCAREALALAFSQVIQFHLLKSVLILMDFLYQVNVLWFESLPVEAFYIGELTKRVHLENHYVDWESKHDSFPICFMSFPCVLDVDAKSKILELDNNNFRKSNQMRAQISTMFVGQPELPCLLVSVRRNSIVNDAIQQLTRANFLGQLKLYDLRKPLKVEFMNEEGIDDGGVKKEFFILLFRDLLDEQYGMFTVRPDSNTRYFSLWADSQDDLDNFNLVGMMCGLAIYNNVIIDVPFPMVLYHKLMTTYKNSAAYQEARSRSKAGPKQIELSRTTEIACYTQSADFRMFASLEPQVARRFRNMLSSSDDVSELEIFFEKTEIQFDMPKVFELKPGGSGIRVDNENREEYVRLYVEYVLHESIKKQYESFAKGFFAVCESRTLSLMHPTELQALVTGDQVQDFSRLPEVTQYQGGFCANHPTVKMFWEVFLAFDVATQQKFLQFLTGSDRVPVGGLSTLRVVIQSNNSGQDYLPVAHTCFNVLDLPIYKSKQVLESKLIQAMTLAEGFHLV
eukprot:scpid26700/ scgid19449/ Probable E3 ubiquitin-protein ligase HERC3; HECT domain and RCC1-like domain-containing protein 3